MEHVDKGLAWGWVVSDAGDRVLLSDDDLAHLAGLGARTVRFELRLGQKGGWDGQIVDQYRRVADSLLRANIAPIGLLSHQIVHRPRQEDWNAGLPGDTNPFIATYVQTATALVGQLPQIRRWEIWNEPNSWTANPRPGVYIGGTFIYPGLYAGLVRRTYEAIKQAAPSSTVISGGLLGHNIGGRLSPESTGADYLRQVYAAVQREGAGAVPFDLVGQHYYLDQGGVLRPDTLEDALGMLRRVIADNEGAGSARGVCITEASWESPPLSGADQATNLQTLFELCDRSGMVQAACWFLLRDNPAARLHHGLCAADGTRKPSFDRYKAV